MKFKIFEEGSNVKWWGYLLIGMVLFLVGYFALEGDLSMFVITIGWGPIIVGVVKLFKENKKVVLPIFSLILLVVGVLLTVQFVSNNSSAKLPLANEQYTLNVPNLNFEIVFPAEPKFDRTDGNGFTRYTWSYVYDVNGGQDSLFVIAQSNFYSFNKSKESFIEETAQIYGGMVSEIKASSDGSYIDYKITGVGSTSNQSENIIGRIADIGGYTVNITNRFKAINSYPAFIESFRIL
ncbi:MAG: hypothetical protein KBC42_03475 [Candidatus Pacebacteria bacterium]|nr:hypothetical protein [Candidatus Paceibacterota bacterium]MBP9780957.1 hypothetical protein [Candidatus Paceibacterota bacterium]